MRYEDFIVEVSELPGCMADSATYEKAVVREWIDIARFQNTKSKLAIEH